VALRQTNEAMLQQIDDARFCTAAYLRVDSPVPSLRVAASSAGHPRPALVRADGAVELLECGGTLLGVVPDPELVDLEVELGPATRWCSTPMA
jgi:serine phosphatase RsbU (regulator of sigma subunit)